MQGRDEARQVEEKNNARDDGKGGVVFSLVGRVGGDEPDEDDEGERGKGSPEVEASDGQGGLQPENDDDAGDEDEASPPAVAKENCPEECGSGEGQDFFKRHLEALIDPCGAGVCGEDDEGDEDEAEEEGEEVFAGEDLFHYF